MQFTGLMDIPAWYLEYSEFTETILKRNFWFIQLRYAASFILTVILTGLYFFVSSSPDSSLFLLALLPAALILISNFYFHHRLNDKRSTWKYSNLLHFAFLQIVVDLCAIAILIYFTGGVESILSLLFVFHIIISALLFPARVVAVISASVIFFYCSFAWLEFFNIIPHFGMIVLMPAALYGNLIYVAFNTLIFSGVICTSALIAFKIASDMVGQQQALFNAFEKLEAAESEKQQYVIAVVHEIKQPVTAVTSFLEVINQNILGEISKEISSVIQKCITRNKQAVEMINNILKVSQLRLMNQIQSEPVSWLQILDDILNRYQPIIERKKLLIEQDLPQKVSGFFGDPFLITLAISNIFSNAIKYNHEAGRILISLTESANEIVLSLADTGMGISEDELKKVTGKFFRSSSLDGKKIEGAGVGLSVVKQIIEKHNGTLLMVSPSGIGDTEHPGTRVTCAFRLTDKK